VFNIIDRQIELIVMVLNLAGFVAKNFLIEEQRYFGLTYAASS
jgi:hypothetical protein